MKKILFVIFVLCLSIVGAFAQEQITVSRFQGQKITGIKAHGIFSITTKQGNTTGVTVNIPARLEKQLVLKLDSDEPAEPGELGRIVITDLFNYAFPILRYDNGDTAVATRKEKNGRYRLYLDELYGRRSDLIYDCEGKAVTPYIITNNLWDIEGVKQYRFIQEDVKDYTIWLNGDPQKMNQEEILGRIRPYLGEEARIRVELVDEIPVLASGKRKYIENRCEKYKNQTGFCG